MKWNRKTLLILCLAILSFVVLAFILKPPAPDTVAKETDILNNTVVHYCYLPGKRYAFSVSQEVYGKMKKWNLNGSDVPPVPAKKAYQLAKARLDQIKVNENSFWTFKGATLQPVDAEAPDGKWIWKITFQLEHSGASTGIWPTMDFLVTMDGELIEPVITDWNP